MARFKALHTKNQSQFNKRTIYLLVQVERREKRMIEREKNGTLHNSRNGILGIFFPVLRFKLDKFVENHQVMNKVEMRNWTKKYLSD